jgi:hypothetical protein
MIRYHMVASPDVGGKCRAHQVLRVADAGLLHRESERHVSDRDQPRGLGGLHQRVYTGLVEPVVDLHADVARFAQRRDAMREIEQAEVLGEVQRCLRRQMRVQVSPKPHLARRYAVLAPLALEAEPILARGHADFAGEELAERRDVCVAAALDDPLKGLVTRLEHLFCQRPC